MRHSRLSLLIGALHLSTAALGRVCYEAVDDASAGILQVIHHIRCALRLLSSLAA